MTFLFTKEARNELDNAVEWYQARNEKAASDFITAVEHAISKAMANPLIYRIRKHQCRFCQLDVFPYLLVFRLRNEQIEILAIAHQSRKPGYWSDRTS